MRKWITLGIAVALLATSAVQAKPNTHHAEGIYAEYSAGTGDQVLFEVETLTTGRLAEFANKTFGDILAVPSHRLIAGLAGAEIEEFEFVEVTEKSMGWGTHDLDLAVNGLTEHGLPVEMGRYRLLAVAANIGDQIRTHEALELCWPRLGHCTMLDPVVVFLQSMVDNRMRLRAEGWGPRVNFGTSHEIGGVMTKASCGLASSPSSTWKQLTWSSRYVTYKNVYGITLVTKSLGSQQSGLRCNSGCNPAPYGYSNSSSCSATGGYTCDCDNKFGNGITNKTGKWISETKCTHRLVLSAKASASVQNYGSASVDINWDLSGGVDSRGGHFADTCGYF